MTKSNPLPPSFVAKLKRLEESYVSETDPVRQSGFGGGAERWRAEREPILDAVTANGTILDVGCANGFLLACLVSWARGRGLKLVPYGIDCGPRLIELAKARLPEFASHFWIANAWDWKPRKRFDYIYAVYDCLPTSYLPAWVERALHEMLTPKGVLILGAYGSRSRAVRPFDLNTFLHTNGYLVSGSSAGGTPPVARFAWIHNPDTAARPNAGFSREDRT